MSRPDGDHAPSEPEGVSSQKNHRIVPKLLPPRPASFEELCKVKCSGVWKDDYVVEFKDKRTVAERDAHINYVQSLCEKHAETHSGIDILLDSAFHGYIGNFHPEVAEYIRNSTAIVSITQNSRLDHD